MHTKLTLRVEERLIERAKAYAKESGRSVSQLIADYLALLPERPGGGLARLAPIVRSLRGLLRGADVDRADFRRHLEKGHL